MTRALIVLSDDGDRAKACRWAQGVPLGSRIEFKETKRTLPQNDLMWAILTEVSQQLKHGEKKYDPAQWKSIFLHAFGREISFLPSLDLKTFLPIELSSSDLSKDEMTNFIEFILKEGTERGVVFREINNEASDAPSPAPDESEAHRPPDASLNEPAGVSVPAGSSSDLFGKFRYEADDLRHIAEYAEKGARECRRSEEPVVLKFLEDMYPKYVKLLVSADAVTALNSIKRGLELVASRERDIDRIEEWIATEFLTPEGSTDG